MFYWSGIVDENIKILLAYWMLIDMNEIPIKEVGPSLELHMAYYWYQQVGKLMIE